MIRAAALVLAWTLVVPPRYGFLDDATLLLNGLTRAECFEAAASMTGPRPWCERRTGIAPPVVILEGTNDDR